MSCADRDVTLPPWEQLLPSDASAALRRAAARLRSRLVLERWLADLQQTTQTQAPEQKAVADDASVDEARVPFASSSSSSSPSAQRRSVLSP